MPNVSELLAAATKATDAHGELLSDAQAARAAAASSPTPTPPPPPPTPEPA